MNLGTFRLHRRVLVAALVLLGVSSALAQVQQGGRGGGAGGGLGLGGGAGAGAGAGGGSTSRAYPNTTTAGEAMISSDVESRRLIIVTDDATAANIEKIIASLDKPKPQVLINVVFLQVTHDDNIDLGVDASYKSRISLEGNNALDGTGTALTKFGVAAQLASPTGFGAFYQMVGRDVNATIHAMSGVTKTEILSRPSILTRSSQQATILVGQSVPIVTGTQVAQTTGAITNTYTYQDVGIILRVTPFITAEGLVEMIVSPEISSISAQQVAGQAVIDKRNADTVVVTPSDRTIVIGGLISAQKSDVQSKVPLLGDIPLLGNAFKRTTKGTVKTELLIFLTPHVVATPDELGRVTASERGNLQLVPQAFEKADLSRLLPTPVAKP